MALLFTNARLLPLAGGPLPRTGVALADLGVIERGWLRTVGDRIHSLGPGDPPDAATRPLSDRAHQPRQPRAPEADADAPLRIDAQGWVLMPAFVDCHTHACWAGDRLDEWCQRLAGSSYLDILQAGGGIMATVRAVRAASQAQLADALAERLDLLLECGSTTVEVKSGYGLDTHSELKMLRAIADAAARWPGAVIPTACIGHALDPDRAEHAEYVIRDTLPAVTAEFPGLAIDAYCERGAWSVEQCVGLFDAARAAGHPCRVHADQFTSLGLTPIAAEQGFISVDHLEAATAEHLHAVAQSSTFGVMLPCSAFHVGGNSANGRAFVDLGGRLAIATNYNPGSAPCPAMPTAIALAVRRLGLTPAEAIAAATVNPAHMLGLSDRGMLAPGLRADLLLLHYRDERELAHHFGTSGVRAVVCAGRWVRG